MSTQSTVSRRPMGVFLKAGNFFLASDVFVVEMHTYTYAVDGIPGGVFDEDYEQWIRVEITARSFETWPRRRTLGSPDVGRIGMWRR